MASGIDKLNYTPIVTGAARNDVRRVIRMALSAVQNFNGSTKAFNKLIGALDAFDVFAIRYGGDSALPRDEIEKGLSRTALGKYGGPVTIDGLLETAIQNFGEIVKSGAQSLKIVNVPYIFLPNIDEGYDRVKQSISVKGGSGAGLRELEIAPRLLEVAELLARNNIPVEEYTIYSGKWRENEIRKTGYLVIQIPSLNREIALCDHVGQATYVAVGQGGPLFWASHSKEILNDRPGVYRVLMREKWQEDLTKILFADDHALPPKPTRRDPSFPLSEEIILIHAIRWAAVHEWRLPTDKSGAVPELDGESFNRWDHDVRRRRRGLTRDGCNGIAHLFRIWGLKNGAVENSEVLQHAFENIRKGRQHGLREGEDNKNILTEYFILRKALEWAGENNWQMPVRSTPGDVPGMPGQKFSAWNLNVSRGLRGFDGPKRSGLLAIYQAYGLKTGRLDNTDVVKAAWENMVAGRPLGLVADEGRVGVSIYDVARPGQDNRRAKSKATRGVCL